MRAVKSVSIDPERRVIITYLDGSTETLYPNCIWCDSEALRQLIKDLLEDKADAITQTIENVTIASFADGAEEGQIKKLLVSIDPIQEGSGDPSPENVRPISGRTGLSVVRSGKNLINPALSPNSNRRVSSVTYENGDNEVTLTTVANANYMCLGLFYYFKSGTYTIKYSATSNDEYVPSLTIYKSNNVVKTGIAPDSSSTFTISTDGIYEFRLFASTSGDGVTGRVVRFYNMQVESGRVSTPWTPYKVNTYTVNWETEAGTVYGGTLDVTNGVLTVDRAKTTLDGTNTVSNVVVKDGFTNCRISGYTPAAKNYTTSSTKPNAVCSDAKLIAVYYAWQNQDISSANLFTINGSYIGMSIPGSFADADAVKAYLTSHNVDVCYEIATPTEIQLTGQEIRTLLGDNNIWADSGNILELEYTADTKLYIGEQQSGTSGTLGSNMNTVTIPDLQPVSEKTREDVEEATDERGEK